MTVTVSAIIPTHNYARFVARAINSALGQSVHLDEVIVVDDGSTDDTPQVLERYHGRIRVVRQPKSNPSIARNNGVKAATGDYIAMLDADDWWEPDKTAVQLAQIEREPDIALIGCSARYVDEDGKVLRVRQATAPARSHEENARAIAVTRLIVGGSNSGALVRRDVWNAVHGMDPALATSEDRDLFIRIAMRYRIANVPDVLTNICQHGTGFARDARLSERCAWICYRKITAAFPAAFDSRTRRVWRAQILSHAADEYRMGGERGIAIRRSLAAAMVRPTDRKLWRQAAGYVVRSVGTVLTARNG